MSSGQKAVASAMEWAARRPTFMPLFTDLLAWTIGLILGATLSMVLSVGRISVSLPLTIVLAASVQCAVGLQVGVYRRRWRVSSFDEVSVLGIVWALTSAITVTVTFLARRNGSTLPTSAAVTGSLVAFVVQGTLRVAWRRFWERHRRPAAEQCKRMIVFGTGEEATQIVRVMLRDSSSAYLPVALLDDDPARRNRELDGVKTMGTGDDLARVAELTGAEAVLVAVHSISSSRIGELADAANAAGLDVLVLPPANELVGRLSASDVRPPTVEDLLGRDPVAIDLDSISGYITGRRVLVTGAGGSIGSELSRQIAGFGPSKLHLLDRDEGGLHAVQLSIEGRALLDTDLLVVANIRDRERVFELFDQLRPDVVFHAAALKHLTLLENHPAEAMKTNVVGTKNLLDAATAHGVERFVNISTDKAADPTSALGATKLAAERLTADAARRTGQTYVSVRFGNVLGSRGSVLPTFLTQIDQGRPITITHPDVTRYFMTIPEAVRLVVQAAAIGDPGDVLILDMGEPVKIIDLARQLIRFMAPNTEIVYTGLRRGEKLHEVLFSTHETGTARRHPRIIHTVGGSGSPSEALRVLGDDAVALVERYLLEAASSGTPAALQLG